MSEKPDSAQDLAAQLRACSRCEFYDVPDKGRAQATQGFCRRNPPAVVLVPGRDIAGRVGMSVEAYFPPMEPTEWCGEFTMAVGRKAFSIEDLVSKAEEQPDTFTG